MKKSLFIGGVILVKLACPAGAVIALDDNWTVNTLIPEGNPVGITAYETFENLPASPIADVSVNLNLSGGYDGDLVGYLTLQDANGNTATEILLSEMGTTPANPFGSPGAGMNVTLSDSGTANGNIHGATGIPTGIWQPDSPNTLDGTFGGLTANGTWTLFLADLAVGGGTSTLNSWGLDVSVAAVPEPAQLGLVLGMGTLLVSVGQALLRGRRKQSPAAGAV